MRLSDEKLLLLDTLVYFAKLSDTGKENDEYVSIGEFINDMKKGIDDYETIFNEKFVYNDKQLGMDKIIDLIDSDNYLKDLVIIYPDSSNLKSTSSVCLVDPDPEKLDVYVIYVGNYADSPYKYESKEISTWGNNVLGAIQSDTDEQKRQLDFYNASIEAARAYFGEEKENEDLNITVSGHSAGGNHAQYVTITYKDYMGDNYETINDIDKCVSFDSQGFSFEFLKTYSQAIENRADKITSYCPTDATVGGCMPSIPGIEEKFIDIGFPNAFPIGYHMPAEMLNENGEFKQEGEPSLKYTLLKKATTCTLAITEKLPGIDVEKTLVEVGEFIDAVANKGDVLGEGKDLIFSKDSIIVLGILLKELEPLVDLNKATLGITVAGATINEIDNCIEEIGDFVESGDIIQAIDRADETFCKLRLGLQLYQGGMLTGNQVVGAVNFII
ncbi:MAG: DUF2974 domain-containing protein [Lachnospiraceae bacterium]|nr:DUF2974 domain-containing protein [Lachnospiraceae bacterium]